MENFFCVTFLKQPECMTFVTSWNGRVRNELFFEVENQLIITFNFANVQSLNFCDTIHEY